MEGATPAFHLRLGPDGAIVGGGIWRPEPAALEKIRTQIVADTKTWQRITSKRQLGSGCGMVGESLKRPPPGFAAAHPCIEDIKRKDFGISVPLDARHIAQPSFLSDVVDGLAAAAPFVQFLTKSVGLAF